MELPEGTRVKLRIRRGLAALVLLIIGVAGVAGCRRQTTVTEQSVTYRKATAEVALEVWQEDRAVDIVLLLDQSGSMSKGAQPTDPMGLRATGSRTFLEFVAQRSSSEAINRFAVVNFGSRAERRHAHRLVPVRSREDPALRSLFSKLVPMELGNTNFIDAMRLALQLLREGGSFTQQRYRAFVIFTDGEPDDARNLSLSQYFAEISRFYAEQLKPNDVEVFIIGIDAAGKRWSSTVGSWTAVVGGNNVFTAPDIESLKSYFNRIVQRIWQLPEVEPVVVSAGAPVEFEVEPYLSNMEFHVFPSQKGLTLKIYRPDGSVVRPGEDADSPPIRHRGLFDVIEVREPEPGMWRYEVVGGSGSIEVLRNPIPWRMRLVSPGAIHPIGKPMRIVVEFKRDDGKPIRSLRDYPLALSADVVTPSGNRTPIKFNPDEAQSGIYIGEPTIEAPMEGGKYQVVLKVSGGEKHHTRSAVTVVVQPVPYLLVDEPSEPAIVPPQPTLHVRCRLLQAGEPLNPMAAFTNHPDYLVIAQVTSPDRKDRGEAVWLNYVKQEGAAGEFVGEVPLPADQEGRYFLVMRIAPEDKAKHPVVDLTVREVRVTIPPEPVWKKVLLFGGVGLLAVILLLSLWLISLPRMSGGSVEVFAVVRAGESGAPEPTEDKPMSQDEPLSAEAQEEPFSTEAQEEPFPTEAQEGLFLSEAASTEEPCGIFGLAGKRFLVFRVRTVGKVKGRWFFINGVKGGNRITVRFFQGGLPRSRSLLADSEVMVGEHIIRYYST